MHCGQGCMVCFNFWPAPTCINVSIGCSLPVHGLKGEFLYRQSPVTQDRGLPLLLTKPLQGAWSVISWNRSPASPPPSSLLPVHPRTTETPLLMDATNIASRGLTGVCCNHDASASPCNSIGSFTAFVSLYLFFFFFFFFLGHSWRLPDARTVWEV